MKPLPLAHVVFAIAPSLSEHPTVATIVDFTPLLRDGTTFANSLECKFRSRGLFSLQGPPVMEERDVKMPAQFANVVQVEANRSRSQAHHVDTLKPISQFFSRISLFFLSVNYRLPILPHHATYNPDPPPTQDPPVFPSAQLPIHNDSHTRTTCVVTRKRR
ncbi:hypothetical protein LZ32DRAFT_14240 [Colletotrichum eremochloae]|nr:hypothetical protein LZ32DRAFT_14240 [Colletotrichum eremochloae]